MTELPLFIYYLFFSYWRNFAPKKLRFSCLFSFLNFSLPFDFSDIFVYFNNNENFSLSHFSLFSFSCLFEIWTFQIPWLRIFFFFSVCSCHVYLCKFLPSGKKKMPWKFFLGKFKRNIFQLKIKLMYINKALGENL